MVTPVTRKQKRLNLLTIVLYLNVNVFSTKVLIETTIFYICCWRRFPPLYVVIRATRRSSHLQGKGNTFIFQSF